MAMGMCHIHRVGDLPNCILLLLLILVIYVYHYYIYLAARRHTLSKFYTVIPNYQYFIFGILVNILRLLADARLPWFLDEEHIHAFSSY